MEEGRSGVKSIIEALRIIAIILTNNRRMELKKLQRIRDEIEKKLNSIVSKHAIPEYKSLDSYKESESSGFTKKIVPTLIRRNSFSGEYL